MNEHILEQVTEGKHLGVIVDNKMNEHILEQVTETLV